MSPEDDIDIYVTKLGGKPVWFGSRPQNSSLSSPRCGSCTWPLFLVMQAYCPLENSPYDRVLYVWGCNRRACMRQRGSWKVVRGHRLDKEYARLLEEKKAREAKRKTDSSAMKKGKGKLLFGTKSDGEGPFGGGFTLGDLWNANVNVKSGSSLNDAGIIQSGVAETQEEIEEEEEEEEKGEEEICRLPETLSPDVTMLTESFAETSIIPTSEPPEPTPFFPAHYIYVSNEDSESDGEDPISAHVRRAAAYELDMELDDDSTDSGGGNGHNNNNNTTWSGESYEKVVLPRGMDKAMQKFLRRTNRHPSQCVRYDAKSQGGSGIPLLYSAADEVGRRLLPVVSGGPGSRSVVPPCENCGGPRSFECQLMPNVLSVLATASNLLPPLVTEGGGSFLEKKEEEMSRRMWNCDMGMEFGTVLVYTCERDCHVVTGIGQDGGRIGYFEEVVLVQLEQN